MKKLILFLIMVSVINFNYAITVICYPNYGGSDCFGSSGGCPSQCSCGSCNALTPPNCNTACCCTTLSIVKPFNSSIGELASNSGNSDLLELQYEEILVSIGNISTLELSSNEFFRYEVTIIPTNQNNFTAQIKCYIYDRNTLQTQFEENGFINNLNAGYKRSVYLGN